MYKLIELTTYNDGTKDAQGIYSFDTLDDASGTFHQKLGGAKKNPIFETEMVMLIDEKGAVQEYQYWERYHEPEPEPESEEELEVTYEEQRTD
jgi:hypothetical protein